MAGLSSGIRASAELLQTFAAARGGNVRLFKIQIEDNAMVLKATVDIKGDEKSDFAEVDATLEEDVPCFILFRMDNTTKEGWLLANWVPENTKVRQKMLYASSRETLKKELGSALIGAEITAAVSRPTCSPANGRAEAPARFCAVPEPASPLAARPCGVLARVRLRLALRT
jgi:hypothetical protein